MAWDYEQQRREQQARDAENQRRAEAQRADQQRQNEARAAQAQREAERARAYQRQQDENQRLQRETNDRLRRENQKREDGARRKSQEDFVKRQQENMKRTIEEQRRQEESRRKQEQDRHRSDASGHNPFGSSTSSYPYNSASPSSASATHPGSAPRSWPGGSAREGVSPSNLRTDSAPTQYRDRQGRRAIGRWLRVGLAGVLGLTLLMAVALGSVMLWRGYLTYDQSGIALHELPVVQTENGPAYRKFDVNLEFRNMNIWTMPKVVAPNSYIDGGPIWRANILCPQGNFRIKGELRDARITVPNGTLIIDGDVLDSYISARTIVTHGLTARTVATATVFHVAGAPGSANRFATVPASKGIEPFEPWYFKANRQNRH